MKKVFLGVDSGTSSVAIAVTDENYHVIKMVKKYALSVRLTEAAQLAVDRRKVRASRRRMDRIKQRVMWLDELFAAELIKKDEGFLRRLELSHLSYEHNKKDLVKAKYTLFCDDNYTDKEYYNQYPTIFHLRQKLRDGDDKTVKDIRLVYLAIHHIIKYRGNFLFEGEFDPKSGLKGSIEKINEFFEKYELFDERLYCDDKAVLSAFSIIMDKKLFYSAIKEKLSETLGCKQNKCFIVLLMAILGKDFKLSAIFDGEYGELDKLNFSKADYDDTQAQRLEAEYSMEYELLAILKECYDIIIVTRLLGDKKYISDAMVENIYDKHKNDLSKLKAFYKDIFGYNSTAFQEMFKGVANKKTNKSVTKKKTRESAIIDENDDVDENETSNKKKKLEKNTYCKYIGWQIEQKIKVSVKKVQKDLLYAAINNDIKGNEKALTHPYYAYIVEEIEKGDFLPKQVSKENAATPNQLHFSELKLILDKAAKFHPFLLQKDAECGLTIIDKLLSIFKFRVPYYVGPLNNTNHVKDGGHAWCVRKAGKITPWNFDTIVDERASAKAFMDNLTSNCRYLMNEPVLPKQSLLYAEYMVLNEINAIKLFGVSINNEIKMKIFQMFLNNKNGVTKRKIFDLLLSEGLATKEDIKEDKELDFISGVDKKLNATLSAYHQFKNMGISVDDSNVNALEDVIEWSITYSGNESIIESLLKTNYSEKFTSEEISRLKRFKTRGWGQFSKKLLRGMSITDKVNGEVELSLIEIMRSNMMNIMQILNSPRFSLTELIKEHNSEFINELTLQERIDDTYCSPSVKRQISQICALCLDYKSLCKKHDQEISKVFIEMARGSEDVNKKKGGKGARTASRQEKLIDLYKSIKNESREWIKEISTYENSKFKEDKLFLYYTQKGQCMYTGEQISIDDLFNKDIYDIDHIIPQSVIKDDSFDNRVLVLKTINALKSDEQLPVSISAKMKYFWQDLLKKSLISRTKFDRLMRTSPWTDEELEGFINRQLVETRQITKVVAEILKDIFGENTRIVYSKAQNVVDFKRKFGILKSRDINHYHHAKDAYLNIVVGNVWDTMFNGRINNFVKNRRSYTVGKLLDWTIKNGEYCAWIPENKNKDNENATINIVMKELSNNSINLTRMTYEAKGAFYNLQLSKKGVDLMPRKYLEADGAKSSFADTERYGGYNSITIAYFMIVKSRVAVKTKTTKKSKNQKKLSLEYKITIECVPIHLVEKHKKDGSDWQLDFCIDLGLLEPVILCRKIKVKSLIKMDGVLMWITGKSGNTYLIQNPNQLKLPPEKYNSLTRIVAYSEKCIKCTQKINNKADIIKDLIHCEIPCDSEKHPYITTEENIVLYNLLLEKLHLPQFNFSSLCGVRKELANKKDFFAALVVEKQCLALSNMLTLFGNNVRGADLRIFGMAKASGKMSIPKNITDVKSLSIIHQSPSGIFEHEEKILPLSNKEV